MPSVARVAYIPLRALALNVIAIYSRSRRKGRKPDSMATVDPRDERLYSLDELTELRRNTLRYARTFPPGKRAQSAPAARCLASDAFPKPEMAADSHARRRNAVH
jgi:hypothetical protein